MTSTPRTVVCRFGRDPHPIDDECQDVEDIVTGVQVLDDWPIEHVLDGNDLAAIAVFETDEA